MPTGKSTHDDQRVKLLSKYKQVKLKIDGYTPHTLPISRLADYLRDLADLLGVENDAHFMAVGIGSAELIHDVPEETYQTVHARVVDAECGKGPEKANRAYRELKHKLIHDRKPAELLDDGDAKVLEFPLPEEVLSFGPITQPGSLEGVLIKLGGRDETVPVHLQDGEQYYKCTATRALAKELRDQLFEGAIRVHGVGKWLRGNDGEWTLDNFKIGSWEKLTEDALEAVLGRMQLAQSDWDNIDDPLGELRRIRKGEAKPN